jgi:nucleoside-diphosphate-sugar epimerase
VNHSGPVFVTGGSGFVGRHIVELLSERGFNIRLLARRVPDRAFDSSVELVLGDLTRPETYSPALQGASVVVHAGLTDNFTNDVPATLTLQKLSAGAGVRKFIHLSSIVVNGSRRDGTVTEETPPVAAADTYSRAKLAIEQGLLANSQTPELLILRLGCVYGPGGGWWSNSLLNMMDHGKLILVNGGTGTANLIHVADAAEVASTLVQTPDSPPGIFHVTDGMPIPWSAYFSELEGILGKTATISMTVEEARAYGRKWLRPWLPRRVFCKLLGSERIHPLDDGAIQSFASRAIYSNYKASTVLGFRPRYDLKSGMETVRVDWNSRRLRNAQGASS